jgi:hypothetical protein
MTGDCTKLDIGLEKEMGGCVQVEDESSDSDAAMVAVT